MKNIKNNIIIIIFAGFLVIVSAIFAFIYVQYANVNKQIAEIKAQQNALSDFNQTYTNDTQKHHNSKIESNDTYAEYSNEYKYNGIYFGTNIEGIDENKLHGVALELLSNLHGDEVNYVSTIVLNEGDERYCKGSGYTETNTYEIPVSLYNFMGKRIYNIEANISHLVIDDVNAGTEVKDMAQALSVAYGYHYVDYYGIVKGTDDDINSKYYELRAQDNENIVLTLPDDETAEQNYRWYLKNIAAYDYMNMMGSPSANRIAVNSKSYISRYYFNARSEKYANPTQYQRGRNSHPHINLEMPMPDEIEGLYDYFYRFIDVQPPVFEDEIKPFGSLNYEVELLKREKVKEQWFRLYDLYWDTITEDPSVLITVVKYDMNDEMLCIESVVPGNATTAPVDNYITFFTDERSDLNTREHYNFNHETLDEFKIRLVVYYLDGRIRISEPYVFGSDDY